MYLCVCVQRGSFFWMPKCRAETSRDDVRQNTNIDFIKCCSIPQWRSSITKQFSTQLQVKSLEWYSDNKDVRNTWPSKNIQDFSIVSFLRTLQRKPTAFPLNKARQWQWAPCVTTVLARGAQRLEASIPGSGGTGGRAGCAPGRAASRGSGGMAEAGWVVTGVASTLGLGGEGGQSWKFGLLSQLLFIFCALKSLEI